MPDISATHHDDPPPEGSALDMVIESRPRDIGAFTVARILPFAKRRMVGPFIFLDHMGPMDMEPPIPREADVRPHPHIGLSTVTYLLNGEMTHRNSTGVEQPILPGAVNWMTAGHGISHSERFDTLRVNGGTMHGLQAWVALPENDEETAPAFMHYDAASLPVLSEQGLEARLIAGSAFGLTSSVKTHSPLFYVHAALSQGARLAMPSGYAERAAYIVKGSVEFEGRSYGAGHMLVFTKQSSPVIVARETSTVMLLGGEPLGARHIWWNFVHSRKEHIEDAKADWRAGRFTLPPMDNKEFTPLPEEPSPSPQPMS